RTMHGPFTVCQTEELLPSVPAEKRRCRRRADLIWRFTTLLIWLLHIFLIFLLVQGVRDARSDRTLIPILFIGWQFVHLTTSVLGDFWRFCIWGEVRYRRKTRLVGELGPAVDIIVVSCGEEIDIILDTLRAACAQDYPTFRVLLSDDGNDDRLEQAVYALRKVAPCELLYYRRPGEPCSKKGTKAGNMNAALEYLDSISSDRTEFCAFLDCDMIVERDFLRACLGHLVQEPTAGVAIVPQSYYNLPLNDPLYQSMYIHNWQDQMERDTLDSVWETGPGVVFRRQAVIDIGGFNEWVLMEDIIAGMLLNGVGWQTIYCYEQLQWGLVPDTLAGHIAQRRKWTVGTVRGAQIARFGFSKRKLAQLSWRQRVVQVWYCISPYVMATQRTLLPLLFLALAGAKDRLIDVHDPQRLNAMLLTALSIGVCYRIQLIATGYHSSYRMARRRVEGSIWLSPYLVLTIVKELLPKGLAGMPIRFIPTGRLDSDLLERDQKLRAPLWRRLTVMILQQGLWYHLGIGTVAASIVYTNLITAWRQPSRSATCGEMWSRTLAPGVDWLIYFDIVAPLYYAFAPPSVSARRDLLEKSTCGDMETYYPKCGARVEQWNWYCLLRELPSVAASATCVWMYAQFCAR
ncbi:Cellulose synthase 1, partial [Pseudocercospora fuligena]